MADQTNFLTLLNTLQPASIIGWRDGAVVRGAELCLRARQWHALLRDLSGDRIALYVSDSIEFAAALFGAWHAGKTVYLPADTLPATCTLLRPVVNAFLGEFPADCAPLVAPVASDALDAPDNCNAPDSATALGSLDPAFAGLVVFTSGSTGAPQAIPKKLAQLAAEVATLEALFGERAGRSNPSDIVATVSHQHIYGLLFKVLWPLACARPMHAHSLIYPEELAQVTSSRDCVLVSSPAHLKRLPDSPAWTGAAHRIRAVFSSGGPLARETADATAQLLGHAPIEVYGSSETGGVAWRQRDPHINDEWLLMPGVECRLDEDGDVLEIRSAHLPDRAWFRSADRARMTGASRFVLLGRVDRIVKIEEKRISLDLMETQLMQSPLVAAARVLVICGQGQGQRQQVAAFAVLTDDGRKVHDERGKHAINTLLREQLAVSIERVALPRKWRYLDAFPVNAQGKTTQAELMALLDTALPADRQILPRARLLEKEDQRALFELIAPRTLSYFEGHFPEAPILPGVAQIEWALMYGREQFDLPPDFRGVHTLKFQQVIRPDTAVSLELVHDPEKNSLIFKFFSDAGIHSRGQLMFKAAHA